MVTSAESIEATALGNRSAGGNRWLGIVLGVQLLAAGPPTLAWLHSTTAGQSRTLFAEMTAVWTLVQLMPWTILFLLAMLHWRPLPKRILLFAPGFALVAIAESQLYKALPYPHHHEYLTIVVGVLPSFLVATATPAFLLRIARRWTLAPADQAINPRQASISTLLIAMTLCGLAAAATRRLDPNSSFIAMLMLAPSASLGVVLVLALKATMARTICRVCLFSAAIALLSLACIPAVAALAARMTHQANRIPISAGGLGVVALLAFLFTTVALTITFASFLWLRLLGYRLLTFKDSR
jgi:hypothetical protein